MDIAAQLFSQLGKIPKKYILPLIIGSLGLILLVSGLIYSFQKNSSRENSAVFDATQTPATQSAHVIKREIIVDIEGAVMHPGVYHLSVDSRVQDLLVAAGGLSENADRDYSAKHINLALKLSDGAKIYFPAGENGQVAGAATTDVNSSGVNINLATIQELDGLPGIGKVTAQKIIDGRPYTSVDDLLSKKIVSSKIFSQIKDMVTIY